MRARNRPSAVGLEDHVGQGETRKVLTHVVPDVRPDVQKDALSFVVTGSVLVGLAEVTGDDRTVHRGDDLGQRDRLGTPGEHVATAHSALGTYESHTLQTQEYLLEVGLGQSRTFGEVAHRRRGRDIVVQGEA